MPTHLLLKGASLSTLNDLFNQPEDALPSIKGAVAVEVDQSALTTALLEKLAAARVGLIIRAHVQDTAEIEPALETAKQTKARALILHVPPPQTGPQASQALLSDIIQRADAVGIAVYFDTHEATIVEDPEQAKQLVNVLPGLHLNLDLAHYARQAGQTVPTPQLLTQLEPLLDRVEMIHGRISTPLEGEIGAAYQDSWAEVMRRWRRRKPAGSTLIFTPLPPETGSLETRLAHSDSIWQIAQRAWKQSAR